MMLIFGSLMYSRAFKARNEIITIIERHRSFPGDGSAAQNDIDSFLTRIGYRQKTQFRDQSVACNAGESWSSVSHTSPYAYCVYKHNDLDFYKIEIFIYLDIPILGEFIAFPVRGETQTFTEWDNWTN